MNGTAGGHGDHRKVHPLHSGGEDRGEGAASQAGNNPHLKEATCIGCGCRDSHACTHSVTGPCWWVKVDYVLGIGVCSECEEKIAEFEERQNRLHAVVTEVRKTA